MLEVLSLVNFNNPKRAGYLERSFGSFHRWYPNVRHVVFDSSHQLGAQNEIYRRCGVDLHHVPGMSFGERLRRAAGELRADYFVFLPDDFDWIFAYPLGEAMAQAGRQRVDEIKLTGRGQTWFGDDTAPPASWFEGARLFSGENLVRQEDLFVSRRQWFKNSHERFSLACNILRREFFDWVVHHIPSSVVSPGQAEKWAYLTLLRRRYYVAYYKMWIPAFHFIDLAVEADTPLNRRKLQETLTPHNRERYHQLFNRDPS